jgi:wyosine [tRNA(Phe)-imidazoG37] synthetase (radical SAM superfamily)
MEYKDRNPRDKLMEIIDDLAEMGAGAITFSGGGEPLIYPHIAEAVNRIGNHKIKLATLTNASHLAGEIAEAFARYGTWIRVSIDGWDGPSYAKYRGVKEDEFEKIIHNMKSFVELKSECVLGINIYYRQ